MMIATGGLLRINARRKDDKKGPPKHHRKHKKKRRSEVVVVKGKLRLCSLAGVFALLGIMVIMVGGAMASLGYWPKDAAFTSINTTITTGTANATSINATTAASSTAASTNAEGETGDIFHFNTTDNFNKTGRGFLEQFLDRYLCNERLKVVGPLVMGAGLFLFICANAVLHESRDQKTKVINLRDIYSTTIDLHQHRRAAAAAAAASPANGLVNCVQKDEGGGKPTGAAEPGVVFSIYTPLSSSSSCALLCPSPSSPLPLHFVDPCRDPTDPSPDPGHDPVDPNVDPVDPNPDPRHDPVDPNPDPKHDPNPDPKHDPIDPNPDPKHDPIDPNPDPKHDPIDPNPDPEHDPVDPNVDPIGHNPDPKPGPIDPNPIDPNPDPKPDPVDTNPDFKHDSVDPKHDPIDPNPDPKHDPVDPNTDPKHDPDLTPDPSLSSQTALPVHRER